MYLCASDYSFRFRYTSCFAKKEDVHVTMSRIALIEIRKRNRKWKFSMLIFCLYALAEIVLDTAFIELYDPQLE
jgi:hypothetical protein